MRQREFIAGISAVAWPFPVPKLPTSRRPAPTHAAPVVIYVGPNWDNPCPSCTSLVDGFDRTWYQVTQNAAFVAIAKAPADRINAWAKQRGWSQIALVSGSDSSIKPITNVRETLMICSGQ
jgi:Bacterial protein of unknown function (DUF899)